MCCIIESYELYKFKKSTDSKYFRKLSQAFSKNEIVLCWIPGHTGIPGNEMVDLQAKTSLTLDQASLKIPFSNFKPSINLIYLG